MVASFSRKDLGVVGGLVVLEANQILNVARSKMSHLDLRWPQNRDLGRFDSNQKQNQDEVDSEHSSRK